MNCSLSLEKQTRQRLPSSQISITPQLLEDIQLLIGCTHHLTATKPSIPFFNDQMTMQKKNNGRTG
jgi:hypothetical protein